MFAELSKDEQIEEFIGDLLSNEEDSFKRRLISGLAALDENGWSVLENFLDSIQIKRAELSQPQECSNMNVNHSQLFLICMIEHLNYNFFVVHMYALRSLSLLYTNVRSISISFFERPFANNTRSSGEN